MVMVISLGASDMPYGGEGGQLTRLTYGRCGPLCSNDGAVGK